MNAAGPPAGHQARARPEDIEDMDPGLARERTVLAWSRTGLSFLALGGVLARVDPLAGLVVLGLAGLVWVLGYFHHRGMWVAEGTSAWLTRPRALLLIAMGTALVGLAALAIAVSREGGPPL